MNEFERYATKKYLVFFLVPLLTTFLPIGLINFMVPTFEKILTNLIVFSMLGGFIGFILRPILEGCLPRTLRELFDAPHGWAVFAGFFLATFLLILGRMKLSGGIGLLIGTCSAFFFTTRVFRLWLCKDLP